MNTLRASRQSEYRLAKVRHQKYLAARRAAKATIACHRNSNLRPLLVRLDATQRAMAALIARGDSYKTPLVVSRLQMYERRLIQQVRSDVSSNTGRRLPVASAGAVTGVAFKQVQASSSRRGRVAAATHVRSARQMFVAERARSAWSPIYPLKWRRWSSPRLDGRPLPRA